MSESDTMKMAQDRFRTLTWDDLQEWIDSRTLERGATYQRNGRVTEISRTPDGKVVARVQGSQRYATMVWYDDNLLRGDCDCPYPGICKHIIALILEYLERLKSLAPIPTAGPDDQRLLLLGATDGGRPDKPDSGDDADEFDEQDEDQDDAPTRSSHPSAAPATVWDYLAERPRERLLELLQGAAALSTAVRDMLQSQFQVGKMVTAARREIAALGSDIGRRGRGWGRQYEGVPDVEPVKTRLIALLQAGRAGELLKLGEELLGISDELIESYDEEGEFAAEIEDCLAVVFEGLAQSDLPPAHQLRRLFTFHGSSEYEITGMGENAFWETERSPKDRDVLVTALLDALNDPDEDLIPGSMRDGLVDRAIEALETAGRMQEIIPLCEREAERTRCYMRLVDRLIAANRWTEAEKWCRRGIQVGGDRPLWGAPTIEDRLRTIYENMDRKDLGAAIVAEEFFRKASADTFGEMIAEAESLGVRPAVEAWARHYLETGQRPRTAAGDTAETNAAGAKKSPGKLPLWPLPDPNLPQREESEPPPVPMVRTLLDIAIREKQPDEVLKWYDHPRWTAIRFPEIPHAQVAAVVGDRYPDRAIAIWKKLTEDALEGTGNSAYQAAGNALRPLRDLLIRQKREPEWREYLSSIRAQHRRKRNLMPILDRLESGSRPIVET